MSIVVERREWLQHTPRVVDDFVDVDTHFVRICMCVCACGDKEKVRSCLGLDVFVHE